MHYRRATTSGATYFFTVVTYQRQVVFDTSETISLLRHAFRAVKTNHPFSMDAIAILPDHLHCVWTLPPNDADFSMRWRLIKSTFSQSCPDRYKRYRSPARLRKQEQAIWQRRFWENQIRDERDLRQHMDYIHYNPVRHGLVNSPYAWPFSSFRQHVVRGYYDADWGAGDPVLFENSIGYE